MSEPRRTLAARALRLAGGVLRGSWWVAATLTWAFGFGWLCVSATPAFVLMVIGLVWIGFAAIRWRARQDPVLRPPPSGRRIMGATAILLAAVGLVVALHATALWIELLLVLTSPWTLTRTAAYLSGQPAVAPRAEQRAAPPAPAPVPVARRRTGASAAPAPWLDGLLPAALQLVDDRDLCWLWRASYPLLATTTSAAELTTVVGARRAYLDELERRHPGAFQRWLASGARAASNPAPYLDRPPRRPGV